MLAARRYSLHHLGRGHDHAHLSYRVFGLLVVTRIVPDPTRRHPARRLLEQRLLVYAYGGSVCSWDLHVCLGDMHSGPMRRIPSRRRDRNKHCGRAVGRCKLPQGG